MRCINYLLWAWTWCSRTIHFGCQSNPLEFTENLTRALRCKLRAQGCVWEPHSKPGKHRYWAPCTEEDPEAQKTMVIVPIKMSRKRLICIPNQQLSEFKAQSCSMTPASSPQQGDGSPRTVQTLAESVLTTDCPLPLNTPGPLCRINGAALSLIFRSPCILSGCNDFRLLRFMGNGTRILRGEREGHVFPLLRRQRNSQPFHWGR